MSDLETDKLLGTLADWLDAFPNDNELAASARAWAAKIDAHQADGLKAASRTEETSG